MSFPLIRIVLRVAILFAASPLLALAGCNGWILLASRARIFHDLAAIPPRHVAIILGTTPRVGRYRNPFFENRMNAAAQLWSTGKVRHFLASGDNSRHEYDEPTAMRDALIARGVPAERITLDYAGFRTFDSMVRAKEVFGVDQTIVVTDDWHQPRALFLANAAGVDALGACSADVPFNVSIKTRVREWFSRVKAVADVYVLPTRPKFLGEKIALPD